MLLREITNEEYTNFVANFPFQTPYQTKEYAFIMNKQGYDSLFLGLLDHNVILAVSLILVKKEHGFKYAYAPKGFLMNYNDYQLIDIFTKEIKNFLGKHDVIALKVNPPIVKNTYNQKQECLSTNPEYHGIFQSLLNLEYYHLGYNNFFEALKPRFEAILDLRPNYITIFNRMKKELRTKIRGAERNGVKVYMGKEEELPYLYEQTKNKYPRDLKYFQDTFHYFGKDNKIDYYYAKLDTEHYLKQIQTTFLLEEENNNYLNEEVIKNAKTNSTKLLTKKLASDKLIDKYKKQLVYATGLLRDHPEGIVLATVLIVKQNKQIHLFMDGYDGKYKFLNAKQLLLWKIIEKYSKLEYYSFNLGGLSNFLDTKHKYQGLNEFKLSFGANVVEYMGDLELITNKVRYQMYRNSAPLRNIIKSKLTR